MRKPQLVAAGRLLGLSLVLAGLLAAEEPAPDRAGTWAAAEAARAQLAAATTDEQRSAAQADYARALDAHWNAAKSAFQNASQRLARATPAPDAPADSDTATAPPATPPDDQAFTGAAAGAATAAELRRAIVGLFESYEREDAAGFSARVAPGFAGRDASGNDYRSADLARALAEDFRILEGNRFTVSVGPLTVQRDGRRAQADVRWSRRARLEVGGREWIVRDQRSVLQFDRAAATDDFRLSRSFGDALFGLANRRGQIVARSGTLDGTPLAPGTTFDRFAGIVTGGAAAGAGAGAGAAAAARPRR